MLRALEGTREARQDAVCRRVAGLQSETHERTDARHVDRRHATSWLLRLQRCQHAQPLLRVRYLLPIYFEINK